MDNIDFATLPDADAARLMAEMDGWRVVQDGRKFLLHRPGATDWCYGTHTESSIDSYIIDCYGYNYPSSLDAAVGWLARMGLIWTRQVNLDAVHVSNGTSWHTCSEDRCSTARALCNAGWAAVQAREASEA